MKNIKFALMAATLLFACFITANAQTADDIIQKYVTAIGGADNWKKVTSLKLTGSISAQGIEMPLTITTVQGKGQKAEFSFNGMTGYQIVTPTTGWSYIPFTGQTSPEVMTPENVKESQDELDLQGPLIDYKAKGNTVTLLGKDQVEGTDCYKLKVVFASGKEKTMFIDAATYYHIRTVEKTQANGKEEESTTNYSNYQKLPEGIMFPMSQDGDEGPIAFKSIEVNKPIDESIFKPADIKK